MLSLFPFFLAFALLVPLMIRLAVGLYMLFSLRTLFQESTPLVRYLLQLITLAASISVLLGAYTQLGSIVLAGISLLLFKNDRDAKYLFLFILSLSLLFLGGGFFAVDLPI